MWKKYLIIILLFLAGLGYTGFYLYKYDKIIDQSKTSAIDQLETTPINPEAQNNIPIYLTEDFWKLVTPQELEEQLKTIPNVNEVRPDDKRSMLHILAEYGKYPEMVQMLVSAGVDYNLRDAVISNIDSGEVYKALAFFYALMRENLAYEFTKAFLEYNDVNSYVINEIPALSIPAYWRNHQVLQLLLEKGADPNLKAPSFANAIVSATSTNRFTNDSYIDPNTIQLLLDHNADITTKDIYGKNAFDYMKENKDFRQTELFKKLSKQFSQD